MLAFQFHQREKGGQMKNLSLCILLIFNFLFLGGCVSSIKSSMDRSKGDNAFYTDKKYSEAANSYKIAANNGDVESSYMLSRILLDKQYGMENIGEGLNRLNEAAASGHVLANRDLGMIYMSGKHGLEKSVPRALPYFEMAASKNDDVSVLALAMIYGSGMGMEKNSVQAARWFAKGQELGLPIPADMSNPDVISGLSPLPESTKKASATPTDSKNMVQEAQSMLTKLGYNPGPADGVAGKKTRQAVRDFQKKRKLAVTGEINAQLLHDLESALSNN